MLFHSLDHTEALWSTWCLSIKLLWHSFILLTLVHLFLLWLNNILLYAHKTFCLSIHLLAYICIISNYLANVKNNESYHVKTCVKTFIGQATLFCLSACQGEERMNYYICVTYVCWKLLSNFSKWNYLILSLAIYQNILIPLHPLAIIAVVNLFLLHCTNNYFSIYTSLVMIDFNLLYIIFPHIQILKV